MPLLKFFATIEKFLGFAGDEDESHYRSDRSARKRSDPADISIDYIHQKVSAILLFFPHIQRCFSLPPDKRTFCSPSIKIETLRNSLFASIWLTHENEYSLMINISGETFTSKWFSFLLEKYYSNDYFEMNKSSDMSIVIKFSLKVFFFFFLHLSLRCVGIDNVIFSFVETSNFHRCDFFLCI